MTEEQIKAMYQWKEDFIKRMVKKKKPSRKDGREFRALRRQFQYYFFGSLNNSLDFRGGPGGLPQALDRRENGTGLRFVKPGR